MKNIKNMIAAALLTVVLMAGTSFANGGIIVADLAGGGQCQQNATDNGGIIVADIVGIIVAGFTGIIVADLNASNETSRTQTVACRNGLILSD